MVGQADVVECFFFSSRRRHTRLQGDWSSDVCSSDLVDEMYEQYLADPTTVSDSWREFFADYRPGGDHPPATAAGSAVPVAASGVPVDERSEEGRGGEEGRSRGAPYPLKKKKNEDKGD